jgi:short-subunit dehydrogenase
LIAAAVKAFGRIDTLVNNAGMSAHATFAEVTDLAWYQTLMRINHWGSVWCTHAALPHLKQSKGRLVAVASLAGLFGVPGRTAYSGTKFAMVGFFEALRTELMGSGVSVTIAYPGVVATDIRYRGFNAAGEAAGKSGLDESGAMSVEECARLIIDGSEARQRDIVMSAKGKLGRWIKLLAPGMLDRMALKALKKEH